jgi:hypothetical protein
MSNQLHYGNLLGDIEDQRGQRLGGATVTISGPDKPPPQVSDAQGRFRFLALLPGTYWLTAELAGFGTLEYPNINVGVGRNTTVALTLSPPEPDPEP